MQQFDIYLQVTRLTLLTTCGCVNECVIVIATHIISCLGFKKRIKGHIRLKFIMYFPNNWVKLLNICECGNNMIITATPIGYHLAIKSKFKNQAGLLAYVIQLIE